MMSLGYTIPAYEPAFELSTVESLLDEATQNLRRHSRGSSNTQKTGGSMRMARPNSTSNSPRGPTGIARRRTVVMDRRRTGLFNAGFISNDGSQAVPQPNRPVSWHPSSQYAPQTTYPNYSVACVSNEFQGFDMPPTPAVYSAYASPASSFSPVSLPYVDYERPQYSTFAYQNQFPQQQQPFLDSDSNYLPSNGPETTMYPHFDWTSYCGSGSTAPPTPDDFLPIQHPDSTLTSDESIPYHALSEDTQEDDGEILCGLGLYDDHEKPASSDPQLNNYRMMSSLLGAHRPESTGKGLKLEETWEPPTSSDDDDADSDCEAEDEDDTSSEPTAAATTHLATTQPYEVVTWL